VRHRRFVIILVLSLWVLAGVLAPMCGSQCLGMGMTCCTSSFCVPVPGVQATLPDPTPLMQRTVFMPQDSHPLTPPVKVPTPPPRDLSFFA
jgi:hypothetical protein